MLKLNLSTKLILLAIFLLAAFLRLYGIDWDQGGHLHPDERAIVMAVVKLQFPQNIAEFLSPTGPWNPQFFAYGSFPFYLLKLSGQLLSVFNPLYGQYDSINIVGRFISAISDLISIFIIFLISLKRFHQRAEH